ncbi:MAG: hypothetical protein KatS3mg111_3389 [Pirellulaceae bacterium]|nr:MAG: hypothetical protein KatS3mg111_3389 [Pirellulaceae bacterium]
MWRPEISGSGISAPDRQLASLPTAPVATADVLAQQPDVRLTSVSRTTPPAVRPIEELRPLDRVLVDAPQNALDADPYASGSLDLTEPGPETHKLLTIQRFQVWEDGTVDDINVRTVQSNEWCESSRSARRRRSAAAAGSGRHG